MCWIEQTEHGCGHFELSAPVDSRYQRMHLKEIEKAYRKVSPDEESDEEITTPELPEDTTVFRRLTKLALPKNAKFTDEYSNDVVIHGAMPVRGGRVDKNDKKSLNVIVDCDRHCWMSVVFVTEVSEGTMCEPCRNREDPEQNTRDEVEDMIGDDEMQWFRKDLIELNEGAVMIDKERHKHFTKLEKAAKTK